MLERKVWFFMSSCAVISLICSCCLQHKEREEPSNFFLSSLQTEQMLHQALQWPYVCSLNLNLSPQLGLLQFNIAFRSAWLVRQKILACLQLACLRLFYKLRLWDDCDNFRREKKVLLLKKYIFNNNTLGFQ